MQLPSTLLKAVWARPKQISHLASFFGLTPPRDRPATDLRQGTGDDPVSVSRCAIDLPGCGRSSYLLLQWHITDRCNLRCAHCYQEEYAGQELAFSEWLEILDQFRRFLRAPTASGEPVRRGHITVTGGEPFARHDFLDLLETLAAHPQEFSFAILTNGTFVDASIAQELRRLRPRFVQVSLEGGPATHDVIRGAGNFDTVITAIRHLVRARVPTLISFTAHRGNYHEFPEIARLGRRLGVARVWADRLIPQGSGSAWQEQLLTPEETREFFELMHRARIQARRAWFRRTDVAMHRALQFLVSGGCAYHCTAGDTLVTVMPNGDLYPCRRMPIRVGNLLQTPLDQLYDCDLFQSLRDDRQIDPQCQACLHGARCRGGLRCLSYAVTGDPFKPDPGCWLIANGASTAGMP